MAAWGNEMWNNCGCLHCGVLVDIFVCLLFCLIIFCLLLVIKYWESTFCVIPEIIHISNYCFVDKYTIELCLIMPKLSRRQWCINIVISGRNQNKPQLPSKNKPSLMNTEDKRYGHYTNDPSSYQIDMFDTYFIGTLNRIKQGACWWRVDSFLVHVVVT